MSGLKTNPNKSTLLPMGRLAHTPRGSLPMVGLPLAVTDPKYLGIRLAGSPERHLELNIGRAVEAVKGSVRFWQGLPLSLMGKIPITKMIVLPRCLHVYNIRFMRSLITFLKH